MKPLYKVGNVVEVLCCGRENCCDHSKFVTTKKVLTIKAVIQNQQKDKYLYEFIESPFWAMESAIIKK